MYFCRINSDEINPLLKESLEINKSLLSDDIYSWYSLIHKIIEDMGTNLDNNLPGVFLETKKLIFFGNFGQAHMYVYA